MFNCRPKNVNFIVLVSYACPSVGPKLFLSCSKFFCTGSYHFGCGLKIKIHYILNSHFLTCPKYIGPVQNKLYWSKFILGLQKDKAFLSKPTIGNKIVFFFFFFLLYHAQQNIFSLQKHKFHFAGHGKMCIYFFHHIFAHFQTYAKCSLDNPQNVIGLQNCFFQSH